jgi:hypothetical protein
MNSAAKSLQQLLDELYAINGVLVRLLTRWHASFPLQPP